MDTENTQAILRELEKSRDDLLEEEWQHLDGIRRLLDSPHHSTRAIGGVMLRRLAARVLSRNRR